MLKTAVIGIVATMGLVFVALVLREIAMKNGMDPVGRLAATISPAPRTEASVPTTPVAA